jgi:hypothetical protein
VSWFGEDSDFFAKHNLTKVQVIAYLEKQKEPEKYVETRWENGTLVVDCSNRKPAEKQDYSGLTDLERAIHRGFLVAGVENVPVTIIKETAKDCLAHIPAWSEEDEKPFNDVLSGLKYAYEDLTNHKSFDSARDIKEAFDWMQARLKSLRPCPSWKPNEEQMKALYEAAQDAAIDREGGNALYELYENLKRF